MILFLDAEIYGDEFRKHPSFEATRTAAIFFDVLGFIALVWGLRRKAIYTLRLRKAVREGKFVSGIHWDTRQPRQDDAKLKRFEQGYLGGQTYLLTAFVLLLCQDIPEAVITVHVIQATPGGLSSIAWFAVVTSCGGVVFAFFKLCCCGGADNCCFGLCAICCNIAHYMGGDVTDGDRGLCEEIFNNPNAPGLCALLKELSVEDASQVQVHPTNLVTHARA